MSSVCCEDKSLSVNVEKWRADSYFKEEFEGGREWLVDVEEGGIKADSRAYRKDVYKTVF